MKQPEALDLLSVGMTQRLPALRETYVTARPFPHVAVEGFLADAFAARLQADFPVTERATLFTEYGRKIGKATVEDLCSLGDTYRTVDAFLRSRQLLELLEQVTGLSGLLHDPDYVGGGTHENLDGQALHPHIDFNHHPSRGWYRRLNLLVYLNPVWDPAWGGNLMLTSDAEDPHAERVTYPPLWNSAVLFETSESSWHGFDRLHLAAAPPGTTRRSLSAYYYTEQPPETAGPAHSTVYVPPRACTAANDADRAALDEEREALLRHLRTEQARLSATVGLLEQELAATRAALRLPTLGHLEHAGPADGVHPDSWVGCAVTAVLRPARPVSGLTVRGYKPGPEPQRVRLAIDGVVLADLQLEASGPFEVFAALHRDVGTDFALQLDTSPAAAAADERELGFVLLAVEAEHDLGSH